MINKLAKLPTTTQRRHSEERHSAEIKQAVVTVYLIRDKGEFGHKMAVMELLAVGWVNIW